MQVARRANIHVNTVRKWSAAYAEFLSVQARGKAGPRLYSDEDVSVLCAVAALRNSGVSPDEVMRRLREDAPSVVDVTVERVVEEATPQPTQATNAGPGEALALYAAQSSLQSRVEALERRMEGHADRLVTGIILGVALTLLVVALALRVV